jgi:hypothetical protein
MSKSFISHSFLDCPSQGQDIYEFGTGFRQHASTFIRCRTGRENVVHQKDFSALYFLWIPKGKGTFYILPALCAPEVRLGLCPATAGQREAIEGDAFLFCPLPDQEVGLIKSAFSQALHVQRHRDDEVYAI